VDQDKLVLFEGNKIRRVIYNDAWWFVINDIIAVLTESNDPAQYFKRLKERDDELAKLTDKGGVQFVPPLVIDIETMGGKQGMYCWNTAGILRLVQSIPSPKAEPFKRWLAQVGYERIQEIENPELAQERMKLIYEQKGYSKDWIEKRLRGIAIRQDLTDEWKERGVKGASDFAILSAEISKQEKPATFDQNKKVAKRGGGVAGTARKATEKELGKGVVSKENYLKDPQDKKLLKVDEK